MKPLYCLLLALSIFAHPAFSTTYLVSPSDASLPEDPAPGDSVLFLPGDYTRSFVLDWKYQGLEGNPLVMQPVTPGTVTFRVDSTVLFNWTQLNDFWVASTNGHNASMLFVNGNFCNHALDWADFDASGEKTYWYDASKELVYIKSTSEMMEMGQISATFSIGVRNLALDFKSVRHLICSGFMFKNFGTTGGNVIHVRHASRNLVFDNIEVNGFRGTALNVGFSHATKLTHSIIKNGYGQGAKFGAILVYSPSEFYYDNEVSYCEFTNIALFERSQDAFEIEAIEVFGNLMRNNIIKFNHIHDLGLAAVGIHFDGLGGYTEVEGNLFDNLLREDLHLENRSFQVNIHDNLFLNNAFTRTTYFQKCDSINLSNNLYYKSSGSSIRFMGLYNWSVENNLVYNEMGSLLDITTQVLNKEKWLKRVFPANGEALYHVLNNGQRDRDEMNFRLAFAGVDTLNADGSLPLDKISWWTLNEARDTVRALGFKNPGDVVKNRYGNFVDMEVPSAVFNEMSGNRFFFSPGNGLDNMTLFDGNTTPYPSETNENISAVFSYEPHWHDNGYLTSLSFANAQDYDFTNTVEDQNGNHVGPSQETIDYWAQKLGTSVITAFTTTPDDVNPNFSVASNPASDFVHISASSPNLDIEFSLTNLKGQLVQEGTGTTVDVSHLKEGVYTLEVRSPSHDPFRTRLYLYP